MTDPSIKIFLDSKVAEFDQPRFIQDDPVSIPHLFKRKQDIEIAGFFAAIFSWGNRKTIIKKSIELMRLMDNAPYEFCINNTDEDLKGLLNFSHRTFNSTDLLYFISFFHFHYKHSETLETAFTRGGKTVEEMLIGFHRYFFSLEFVPARTMKHIATPERNSSCKRLNMFLRWMVRKDNNGVDLGIWEKISPAQLICPIDLHVARVAKRLGLISGKQSGWKSALELTSRLREFDPEDPVKYDFALFGLGIIDKF
jgi:uncharacterized protein (TIGR02757 family)